MKQKYYEALEAGMDLDCDDVEHKLSAATAVAIGRGVHLKEVVHAFIGGSVENAGGYAKGIDAVNALQPPVPPEAPAEPAAVEHHRGRRHTAEKAGSQVC